MDVESSYFSPWFKQSHRCFFFILWYTAKCFMYISKFFTQNIKACAINDWDLIKLITSFLSTFLSENANEEQWLLVKYDATPLICAKSTQFYPSLPFHHCTNINTVKKDKYHKNKFDFAHQLKESWTPVVCGPHFENHCQLVFFWNLSCLLIPNSARDKAVSIWFFYLFPHRGLGRWDVVYCSCSIGPQGCDGNGSIPVGVAQT